MQQVLGNSDKITTEPQTGSNLLIQKPRVNAGELNECHYNQWKYIEVLTNVTNAVPTTAYWLPVTNNVSHCKMYRYACAD